MIESVKEKVEVMNDSSSEIPRNGPQHRLVQWKRGTSYILVIQL